MSQISQESTPFDPPKPDLPENYGKTIWALAWPAVALNSLQVVNTLLDRTFVGHLHDAALKAIGGGLSIQFLMFSLAFSLGTASTALVSRAFGAKDPATYQKATRQCLVMSGLVGLVLMFLGFFMTPFVARGFFPENREAQTEMIRFLHVYMLGLPAIGIIQTLAGALRGIGDTKSPMFISGVQIFLHIIYNVFFIFQEIKFAGVVLPGMGWGIAGASGALALSAWVAAIGYLIFAGKTELGNLLKIEKPDMEWAERILKIAAPTAGMSVLRVGSLTMFTVILAQVANAEAAIAALPIAFSIESIMFMPAFGLSMAAGALVGQSLGAKQPDRASRIGWLAGHYGALVIGAAMIPLYLGADWIGKQMINTESPRPIAAMSQADSTKQAAEVAEKKQIAREAASLIRILCLTEIFFGYSMILVGAMQGAGDTMRPFWIALISLWLVRVPLAWILANGLGLGSQGAYWAMTISQLTQGIHSMWEWGRGRWRVAKV